MIIEHSIGVIGNYLYLIPYSMSRRDDFWILKEYDVTESWTKVSLANLFWYFQPLCSLKDSDFILSVLDGKFVLFDPSDGTIKDFVIKGFQENLKDFSMQVYAENLISPNSKTNFLSEGMNNSLKFCFI